MKAVVLALAVLATFAAHGQEIQIEVEATVPGDSREAEVDAFQVALRAVVDSAVVRVIGRDLVARFPREIEAHLHAQRMAYVKSFFPPLLPPDADTPYDGRTYRRVKARVRLGAVEDTLIAMGLAWRDDAGRARACEEVTVNFAGFSPDDAREVTDALLASRGASRALSPLRTDLGVQQRFLVPGDAWALAKALGKTSRGRYAVAAVQGGIVDLKAGGDPSARPAQERSDLPPIEIQELWFDEVFPARHALYRGTPVGRIVLARHAATPATRVELEIVCPEFLDVPLTVAAGALGAGETKTVPLTVPFSAAKLLRTKTDTQAMARVIARCWSAGGSQEAASTTTFTVHGRNAIDWEDVRSACAFVTPEAGEVQRTTRAAAGFALRGAEDLPGRLGLGFKVVRALTSFGLHYVPDPTSTGGAYDRVQFPGETLSLRSGDCEDSAVLLASCMEGGDIAAQLLLTRDHVFAAFNTGLYEKDGFLISPDRDRYIVRDGMVWLPLETTLLSKGFMPAWDEGVRTYRELARTGEYLEQVTVREGWTSYPPATPDTEWPVAAPDDRGSQEELSAWVAQRRRALTEMEAELRAAVAKNPADTQAVYRLATILGRTDRAEEALVLFRTIPDADPLGAWARVGEGNCHLVRTQADSAIGRYLKAAELTERDPVPWVNVGVAYQMAGDAEGAGAAFGRALALVGGNEGALERLLGIGLRDLGTKAADAESQRALSEAEIRALMERARAAHAGKQVAERGPSRHKFAGRKALDPEQRHRAEKLIYWPEPQS